MLIFQITATSKLATWYFPPTFKQPLLYTRWQKNRISTSSCLYRRKESLSIRNWVRSICYEFCKDILYSTSTHVDFFLRALIYCTLILMQCFSLDHIWICSWNQMRTEKWACIFCTRNNRYFDGFISKVLTIIPCTV